MIKSKQSWSAAAVDQILYSVATVLWTLSAVSANQNYSSFNCFNNANAPPDYVCGGVNEDISSLDPNLIGIFYCDTPFLTFPDPRNCSSFCGIASRTTGAVCNSCGVMESGSLAFDCSNLYPEAECNEKDRDGNCGEEFVNWVCITQGLGYVCTGDSIEDGVARNLAFPYDVVPDSLLLLNCANDIGGKGPKDCQQPVCSIVDQVNYASCSSCQLLDDGTFAYDCAAQIPYMNCSILDENGECQNATATSSTEPPEALKDGAVSKGSGSSWERWSHTFEDIDPTLFNVLSDTFAYITRVLVGLAIAALAPIVMSFQLRWGGTIPLNELSAVPGDFLQATQQASILRWSVPALFLLFLLTLADFSHTIADIGLDFVTITQEGAAQPVLDTSFENRNPNRLMRTMGDPMYSRTAIYPKVLYTQDEAGNDLGPDFYNYDAFRPLKVLADNFMNAVTLVALGGSPFVTSVVGLTRDVVMGNVTGFVGKYNNDGSPLSTLKKQIPWIVEATMRPHPWFRMRRSLHTHYQLGKSPLKAMHLCPTVPLQVCAHPESMVDTAVNQLPYCPRTFNSAEGNDVEHPVFLFYGNQTFKTLELTPEDKKLARDRSDWKQGRRVSGIDGIVIGVGKNNMTVELGEIVLASGQQITSRISESDLTTQEARNKYVLVGEILGTCPLRPSGLPLTENTQCLTLMEFNCDAFPEDFAPAVHPVYWPANEDNSPCDLTSVNFVYGTGFKADAELVTVVAGLYGVTVPNILDQTARTFLQHAVLAALFAMGTLRDSPSTEEVVRPNVNAVFIFFMMLPAALSLILVAAASLMRRWLLPIPYSPWELMVLAKDSPDIPHRNEDQSYPSVDDTLAFTFFDAPQDEDDLEDERATRSLGIVRVTPKQLGGKVSDSLPDDEAIETKDTAHGAEFLSDSNEENLGKEDTVNKSEKILVKSVILAQGSFLSGPDKGEEMDGGDKREGEDMGNSNKVEGSTTDRVEGSSIADNDAGTAPVGNSNE